MTKTPALIITSRMVTEFNIHEFVVEASELKLAPGDWPEAISTDMGNGLDFIRQSLNDERAVYRQLCGCIDLTILND